MKNRIIRKIIHILFGINIILLFYMNILTTRILFYFLLLSIFLSILSLKIDIPIVKKLIIHYKKENEMPPGRGFIFFLFGSLLVLKLFEKDIALASITILTFSDSFACIFGSLFGKIKILNENKTIEGTILGIIIGTILASFFVNFIESFLACSIAMLGEHLEFKISKNTIDDNLIIPLISGTTIYILRLLV
ncbi:MAG: hypothetical protein QW117_01685 [Candidatus Pacearchaeota archaeon]